MIDQNPHYSPVLDRAVEGETHARLVEHYQSIYKDGVNNYVDMIMATEPFAERFLYLQSVIGTGVFSPASTILISGFGVGSEMIMARQFGFGKVYGVEVEQFLVDETLRRFQQFSDLCPIFYDGDILPYDDEQFHVVASGHVIEHTSDPRTYLQQHLRVLRAGGYLFLEFPHRYYLTELHTGLFSFEWLPRLLRNLVLRILSSNISALSSDVKHRYLSILGTNLQQISMGGVMKMVNQSGFSAELINRTKAAPGIIRCVIRKNLGGRLNE